MIIDPTHPIAKMNAETLNSLIMATRADERLKFRSREKAWARQARLKADNRPVPTALSHYCAGLQRNIDGHLIRSTKNYYRERFLNI